MASPDHWPTVADVGLLLHARTVEGMSGEQGTFTTGTRPTAVQVTGLIGQAAAEVDTLLGGPLDSTEAAHRALIVIRAAMLVELSYFPEQSAQPGSMYDSLRDLYEAELEHLVPAVRAAGRGDDPGVVDDVKLPSFTLRARRR